MLLIRIPYKARTKELALAKSLVLVWVFYCWHQKVISLGLCSNIASDIKQIWQRSIRASFMLFVLKLLAIHI